jgi:hypothetical protein
VRISFKAPMSSNSSSSARKSAAQIESASKMPVVKDAPLRDPFKEETSKYKGKGEAKEEKKKKDDKQGEEEQEEPKKKL